MKKVYILVLIAVILIGMVSCSKKATLNCDGKNCKNKVEVAYKEGDREPDDSWIVFCESCSQETLDY